MDTLRYEPEPRRQGQIVVFTGPQGVGKQAPASR